jgi:hypothetical protein
MAAVPAIATELLAIAVAIPCHVMTIKALLQNRIAKLATENVILSWSDAASLSG